MNDMMELMKARHSVRQYLDKPIPEDIRRQLDEYTAGMLQCPTGSVWQI